MGKSTHVQLSEHKGKQIIDQQENNLSIGLHSIL